MKFILNILILAGLLFASCEDSYRNIKPVSPGIDTVKVQPQTYNGYLHLIEYHTFWEGNPTGVVYMKHYSAQIYVRIKNNQMSSEFTIDNEKEYMVCTRTILPHSYDFSTKPSKIISLINNGIDTDSVVYYLEPVPEQPQWLTLPCNN